MSSEIQIEKDIDMIDLSKIIPYEKNAKKHTPEQIEAVANSIRRFGFNVPLILDPQHVIVAGHCRFEAAKKIGIKSVPCIIKGDLTPKEIRAYRIADNKLNESIWDQEILLYEMSEIDDVELLKLTGVDPSELDGVANGLTDDDAVPPTPEKPKTRRGDVYLMGAHRLMCGDSLVADDVRVLLKGGKADLVFTDPPYNVDYEGYTEEKLKIKNDKLSPADFEKFLCDAFASYRIAIKDGASLYVCHPDWFQREFQNALEATGFVVRTTIVWAKNTFGWGYSRYKFQHEGILYAYVSGEKDNWYGDKSQSTLWQENKPAANRLHPTMKPVELVLRAIQNSSKAGDMILDLFGGSGSTLIASEKTNRSCYLMELDPAYCDVIVKRWEDFTGKKATLAKNA